MVDERDKQHYIYFCDGKACGETPPKHCGSLRYSPRSQWCNSNDGCTCQHTANKDHSIKLIFDDFPPTFLKMMPRVNDDMYFVETIDFKECANEEFRKQQRSF